MVFPLLSDTLDGLADLTLVFAGAVENWVSAAFHLKLHLLRERLISTPYGFQGLIIGSPVSFLLDPDPDNIDLRSEQRVAHMQCHETAHMWCVTLFCFLSISFLGNFF